MARLGPRARGGRRRWGPPRDGHRSRSPTGRCGGGCRGGAAAGGRADLELPLTTFGKHTGRPRRPTAPWSPSGRPRRTTRPGISTAARDCSQGRWPIPAVRSPPSTPHGLLRRPPVPRLPICPAFRLFGFRAAISSRPADGIRIGRYCRVGPAAGGCRPKSSTYWLGPRSRESFTSVAGSGIRP